MRVSKFITAAAVVAIAIGATTTMVAAPANAASTSRSMSADDTMTALASGIDAATRTFDGAAARLHGAPSAEVSDFAAGWQFAGGTIVNVTPTTISAAATPTPAPRACRGANRADYTGLQANVYLDSCNTTRAIALIGGGASVATVAGAIASWTGVGALAAGLAAGALGLVGAVLNGCAAKGTGVGMHNIPPTPVTWCAAQ